MLVGWGYDVSIKPIRESSEVVSGGLDWTKKSILYFHLHPMQRNLLIYKPGLLLFNCQ